MNAFFGQSVAGAAGRRSRVRRRAAMLVIAPASAYLVLMTSSLLGGPTFSSPLLPYTARQAPTEPQAGLLPVGTGGDTSVRMEAMPPTPGGTDEAKVVGPRDPALDDGVPDVVAPAGTASTGVPTVGQQQTRSTEAASAGKAEVRTGSQTGVTSQSRPTSTSKYEPPTAPETTEPTSPATTQPTQPADPPPAEEPAPADPAPDSGPLEPVVEILTPVVDPLVDGVGGLLVP